MKSANRPVPGVAMAGAVSTLGSQVDEMKVKKKSSRKISAPPWLKGRLVGAKAKGDKSVPAAPCCGVEVAEERIDRLEERQFEDKSVQCDDLLPYDGHRFGSHRNSSDRCSSCCHPVNPIYQTNLIVNQIPFMDDELDDGALATFQRNHHAVRQRRNSRIDGTPIPSQALFRKNNIFATPNGTSDEMRRSLTTLSHNNLQDWNRSHLAQSEVSIPNSIEYDQSVSMASVERSKPRVPLRRKAGAYGNVTLNVQIANGMNTTILEAPDKPVVPRRRYGVAPDRRTICESQRSNQSPSQSSCLVLGMNSDARNPLNYKMYTPFYNKRQTMPPEHFKNWPSASRYDDENELHYRTLSYYSEVSNQLEQYERRSSFDTGSSRLLNAIDSNSIMYRSSMDNLPKVSERIAEEEPTPPESGPRFRKPHVGKYPATDNGANRLNRNGPNVRAKNMPNDRSAAQTQSNLLAPPTTGTFGRWSGSIQNLFSIGNRASNGAGRWSKSENCLNEVGQQRQQHQRVAHSQRGSSKPWADRLFGRTGKHGRSRRTNTFLTSGGGSFFTYKYDDEEESAWQKYFSLGMLRKIRPKPGKPSRGKDDSRLQRSRSQCESTLAGIKMDEEAMWKGFYDKIQEQKQKAPTEHQSIKWASGSGVRLSAVINITRAMHSNPLKQSQAFVNGRWVGARSGATFDVQNPANGQVLGAVPDMTRDDVQLAIDAAHEAFYEKSWHNSTAKERAALLKNWYALMEKNRQEIASIMTAESGKPLVESLGEVTYGNSFVEWFAEEARRIYGEIVPPPVANRQIMMTRQPVGVAGLITPWNFPHAMITRKAAAAIAAGCTVVIKPAEDTPLTALALARLAEEAGFPKGVINVITSSRTHAAEIGQLLCGSDKVAAISFTGSTEVGKQLYRQCADGVKRIGLELGGNAPFIVFKSADMEKALTGAMNSKFRNCGQTCISANRFLIQDEVHDDFVEKLIGRIGKLAVGDGSREGVQIGPLINQAQLKKVEQFVQDAKDKGATIRCGGRKLPNHGPLYYEPTVVTDLRDNMLLYNEEVFGPVVSVVRFKTEEEALAIANSTRRGLAGYFFSNDLNQVFRVGKLLETGMIGINEGLISATEAAFGGIKESGIGREGSRHGIDEYVYIKYLCYGNLQ
uniref:Aldehyde dehydrogenase domain-containing protein n=1 Tax=Anopheles farauti TaxID=69004 RepID=A0A182Q234_9DIPT